MVEGHEKEYIIFCDESDKSGKYYSNFYGGLIVGASQYQRITDALNALKLELNLYGEIKWEKVTERYLDKYKALLTKFFDEVRAAHVRVRVMFRQNAIRPVGLTVEDLDLEYFKLYYQFIKHGFGLEHIPPRSERTRVRLYFDQFPDTKEKAQQFKGYLHGLQVSDKFFHARLHFAEEDIAEVRSHDHVLLQCLDVVLGSICFRLNDKHRELLPGKNRRGRRTRAKERLYKHILQEICTIRPNFNIGSSTGDQFGINRWLAPYTHWNFQPKASEFDASKTKSRAGRKQ